MSITPWPPQRVACVDDQVRQHLVQVHFDEAGFGQRRLGVQRQAQLRRQRRLQHAQHFFDHRAQRPRQRRLWCRRPSKPHQAPD
jgi:hypothetical protein